MRRATRAPALVGRQSEVELLRGALASPPAVVRISGDAGIGKSRLAREAIAMARERGFAVQEAACSPHDASIAYAPFRELIRGQGDATLDALLAHDPKRFSPVDVDERRRAAFVAWRDWLEASAANRPLCLCIEDLHWCDEVSLSLLADIALRQLEVPCVMLRRAPLVWCRGMGGGSSGQSRCGRRSVCVVRVSVREGALDAGARGRRSPGTRAVPGRRRSVHAAALSTPAAARRAESAAVRAPRKARRRAHRRGLRRHA